MAAIFWNTSALAVSWIANVPFYPDSKSCQRNLGFPAGGCPSVLEPKDLEAAVNGLNSKAADNTAQTNARIATIESDNQQRAHVMDDLMKTCDETRIRSLIKAAVNQALAEQFANQ